MKSPPMNIPITPIKIPYIIISLSINVHMIVAIKLAPLQIKGECRYKNLRILAQDVVLDFRVSYSFKNPIRNEPIIEKS